MYEISRITELLHEIVAEEVMPRFGNLLQEHVISKASEQDPHDVVSVVDHRVEERLGQALAELAPGSVIIGEEAAAEDSRIIEKLVQIPRLWIIDPIDGTKAFVRGEENFGVMLAYLESGVPTASWIVLPTKHETFVAERGAGAFLNNERMLRKPEPEGLPIGSLHTKFMSEDARHEIKALLHGKYSNRFSTGCAAVGYTDIARGRKDFAVYYRLMPWDHAPGALLLRETGGEVRHLDGTPYSISSSESRPTLACRTEQIWHQLVE